MMTQDIELEITEPIEEVTKDEAVLETEIKEAEEDSVSAGISSDIDQSIIDDAKLGNEDACSMIFDKYKNFVYLKARNYFLMGAEKEDLIQEGMIGLLKAIRGYDKNKLTSFKTFASICIKRQLITAIKTANSQKNFALNNVVDIYSKEKDDEKNNNADEDLTTSGKGLESYISYNPEEIYLSKEEIFELKSYLKANLSGFEYNVFHFMIEGMNYKDIADKLEKKIKSIDNAMQRIKRKSEQWIKKYKEV